MRDQRDSLLDEAGRRKLTIREALIMLCEREIAREDQRRIEMSFGLARFPFHRDLTGYDSAAQPSIDLGQIRNLATGRFIANGEAVLLLGPPPWARRILPLPSALRRSLSMANEVWQIGFTRKSVRRRTMSDYAGLDLSLQEISASLMERGQLWQVAFRQPTQRAGRAGFARGRCRQR
ncbi:ATP-binding protein [Citreicella sp. C3M06]|uniref:ATP-binding protein n=1 Tax=Citreicella sp. C3M06 TaxID=2841564 RepID=UPI00273818E6|nr:ATP-binding protein [Citreicella sp. C3M06]